MDGVNKVYEEPCLETIDKMADKVFSQVITSPPYWMQRDYGDSRQWGMEETPQEFLEHLWQLMGSEKSNDGLWRVLRDDGSVWINLGDTYSQSGASGSGDAALRHTMFGKEYDEGLRQKPHKAIGYKEKCLLLLPHRFAIGCIERGWIVRNDIVWIKPNCQPEPFKDRFSKKKEYMFLMTKSSDYYFDLDSIRDEPTEGSIKSNQYTAHRRPTAEGTNPKFRPAAGRTTLPGEQIHELGKNPGDVTWFWDNPEQWSYEEFMQMCSNWYHEPSDIWEISTRASNADHFATYNYKLVEKPIIAGCPEFICKRCGKPKTKIWEKQHIKKERIYRGEPVGVQPQQNTNGKKDFLKGKFIGWNECKCNAGFRPGIVYDPFAGTGTTLRQAVAMNRWAVGSEIVPKNVKMINEGLGLFANQSFNV